MTKKNMDKPSFRNRRGLLKKLGASTAAISGLSSTVSGKKKPSGTHRKANNDDIESALSAEKTKTLLEELDNPSIKYEGAETRVVKQGDNTYRTTTLPTPLGEIMYGRTDAGSGMSVAILTPGAKFTDKNKSIPPGIKKKLPEKYQAVPNNSSPQIVVADSNQPEVVRHATQSEQKILSEMTGIAIENLSAVISSNDRTFYAVNEASEKKDVSKFRLSYQDAGLREATNEELRNAEQLMSTQDLTCWGACSICLESTIYCFDCAVVCVASIATWPVMIACVTCLVLNCGASGWSCNECLDCHP